ncbi:hypothetical protein SUGI_0634440 [Cryptomeria japonica]|nr:hypothetical protein SUGI_0634440 [Cryptomeria japonica]
MEKESWVFRGRLSEPSTLEVKIRCLVRRKELWRLSTYRKWKGKSWKRRRKGWQKRNREFFKLGVLL